MSGLTSCCFSGTLDKGTPTGKTERLGGVTNYVARPSGPASTAVLIGTDVFGLAVPNTKLIADQFAKEGFLAVVPDLFGGYPLPAWLQTLLHYSLFNVGLHPPAPQWPNSLLRLLLRPLGFLIIIPCLAYFMIRHRDVKAKCNILSSVMDDLKADQGVKKFCVAGYCYGTPIALHFAKLPNTICAFASAHGQIQLPGDIQALKKPGFFALAEHDPGLPASAAKQLQSLISKRKDIELRAKMYPKSFHGFAIRGNASDPDIQAARQDVLDRMVEMFKRHTQ